MDAQAQAADSSKPLTLNQVDKHLKLAILSGIGAAIVSACITWVGFYFHTKESLKELNKVDAMHTEQIGKITESLNVLTTNVYDISTKTAVISTQPDNINKQIQDLNARMARVESQQDKIYDILIDLSKRK